ncbi:MAG: hypothetical protein AB1650_08785 [Candidatus Omnitrophota bacterium]
MSELIVIPKFLRKSSPVFKYFMDIDDLAYDGISGDGIISFTTNEKSRKGKILMISMIQKQEAEIWQAYQELMADLLAAVEVKLHGIYRFELLSMHMDEKMEKFQRDEFLKGMTELALGMAAGKPQFVQYCSILGILTKHEIEDYGKISFRPRMQILDYKAEELDIPLERLIKANQTNQAFSGVKRLIFYDLSRQPLYDCQNEQQSGALARLGRKFDRDLSTTLTEVAIIDRNGQHTFFQKSQMEFELF